MEIEYAIKEFINRQTSILEHTNNTTESYKRNLNKFKSFLSERNITDVNDITDTIIEEYIDSCKYYEKSTQNQIITTLRQFFKDYELFHHLKNNSNPVAKIESIKNNQHLPTFLSEKEMNMFLDIKIESDKDILRKALFELLYCGGLRVSECANLQMSNLHFSANMIRFIGKGNKERVVLLHDEAIEAIQNYINIVRDKIVREKRVKSNNVFIKDTGKLITRNDIYKLVKTREKECGITKNISPHSLRHSYATHMLEEGANLVTIQELLGHSDIRTTQVYTHITTSQMRDTYDQFFPKKDNKK